MNPSDLDHFITHLKGLFTQKDEESGFIKIWGYIVTDSEQIITFWRHREGVNFSFMFLDSYVRPTTLAAKETEKLEHGYDPRDPSKRKHRRIVREIYAAYMDTIEHDGFHYTPHHAAAGAAAGVA